MIPRSIFAGFAKFQGMVSETDFIRECDATFKQGAEFVNFISSNSFADGSELELLISTDWDGNENSISTSTWEILNANISSDSDYYQNWVDSGLTDLSSYSGNAYIAIKYIGSDVSNYDGTFEIDDFQVLVQN